MPPRPTGGAGGDVAADWEKHPVVKILLAQTSVAGIRISIHKDYWDELKNVADCPPTTEDEPGPDPTMWPRIVGTLKRWQNQKERKLRVAWYDTEQTNGLQSMVDSDFNVKFEKYADGRDPPRGRGDGARGVEPAAAPEAEVTFTAMYTVGTVDQMLTWSQMSKEGVRVDPRKDERFKPKIKSGHIKDINTPYKMVKLMLPPKWLSRMEKYINQRLTGLNHKNRKTTQGECERFLWYMVALAIHSGIPLEEAWRVSPKALMPALHLGRFGMSFKRFKKLRHLMGQCFDLAGENMDMKDPYRYCRFWPEEYNEHMQDIMTPGWILAPDESMSQFKPTLSGVSDTEPGVHPDDWDRIPNLDWVPRKPEPLGKELKTMCDGCCGAFINVEMQEGKERHSRMRWYEEWGHTTAQCLRLAQPWLASTLERVFVADSWFMGVRTAEALWTLSSGKMYALGDVKTNSSGFPKNEFISAVPPGDGEWMTFSTRLKNLDHPHLTEMDLFACAHRRGSKVHTYLFNAGTTLVGQNMHHDIADDADPDVKVGGRPAPKVLNDFTAGQPHSDVANKYRQHELRMEARFPTTCFPFRLLTTMWGIVLASAARSFQYFHPGLYGQMSFLDFCREAATIGLDCDREERDSGESGESEDEARAAAGDKRKVTPKGGSSKRHKSMKPGSSSPAKAAEDSPSSTHTLASIRTITGWKGGNQQECGVCGKRVTTYCVECSSGQLPTSIKPVHQPSVNGHEHTCFKRHVRAPHMTLWRTPKAVGKAAKQ